MDSLAAVISAQLRALPPLEFVAVVLAIGYLLLAIRQNIWCWLCAAVSTALFVYLFLDAKLYMQSLLNGFYFAMALYGWYVWHFGKVGDTELPVSIWPGTLHAVALLAIAANSLASGYLLDRFTDAEFPYVDSMTAWSAIWATFLMARKVLENWWYWLVIDLVSIYIYWARDLQLTSLLFLIYVVLVPIGLMSWTRSYRAQTVA
ncbi:MAG: nicotinamide riboside transporter PnuC [Woeseia sp.]